MKKMNNKGFSLVELIIVIAIMAILVAVLAPTYLKFVERSRKSTDCQNVAEIITAVQVYAADPMVTDQFTAGSTATISLPAGSTTTIAAATTDKVEKACLAAGIKSYGLKSKNWNGGNAVVVTFTIGSDMSVTAAQTTPAATATLDITKGLYE